MVFVSDKIKMEGLATMYMRMPMSTSTLPIQGNCTVNAKLVCLKFPFTGIEFELPGFPPAGSECAFKIHGAKGDMLITIDYIKDLDCFSGVCKQEEDDYIPMRFTFWGPDSPMRYLPSV